MLQCVAVCCSVLQCVAVLRQKELCALLKEYRVLQCVAVQCSGAAVCPFKIGVWYRVLQCVAVWCIVAAGAAVCPFKRVSCVAACCSVAQRVAAWCRDVVETRP